MIVVQEICDRHLPADNEGRNAREQSQENQHSASKLNDACNQHQCGRGFVSSQDAKEFLRAMAANEKTKYQPH